ncbi:hypothetical protein [uncultured Rhodoblastus sp.]|uniref:hypothetical protein n=1 Tax=uncultured Rhodoblastus sp. TaxID=543037 RepID=UPI0025DA9427|nr:hypothetical protein [uncultured Rhodoblastus sp.]
MLKPGLFDRAFAFSIRDGTRRCGIRFRFFELCPFFSRIFGYRPLRRIARAGADRFGARVWGKSLGQEFGRRLEFRIKFPAVLAESVFGA